MDLLSEKANLSVLSEVRTMAESKRKGSGPTMPALSEEVGCAREGIFYYFYNDYYDEYS